MPTDTTTLPEIVKLLAAEPDAQRLVRALLEAAAWLASPEAQQQPAERARIAAQLASLVQREREIRTLSHATAARSDGRAPAILADAVAQQNRAAWLRSLHRLADLLDDVRPQRDV